MSREWYPWFPHRFWTSEKVVLMDDAAVALYKFLLDHEWENGPFSADDRVIRAICARFKSFDTSWPQVQPCFRKGKQGKYFNERMEQERELERQAAHARAERSKSSWTKRRDEVESKSNAHAEHMHRTRSRRAKHVQSTQPDAPLHRPTDLPTDLPTDGSTNAQTGVQGEPAPSDSPSARRKRAPFDWRLVLLEFPALDTPEVREACGNFCEARRSKHGPWTAQGMRIAIRKFERLGPPALVRAFEQATESPWMTIKTPEELSHGPGRNGSSGPRNGPHAETALERRKREGMNELFDLQRQAQ